MTPKDAEQWAEFTGKQDFEASPAQGKKYAAQIMLFAVEWADKMELLMADGVALSVCAEDTSYEMDEKFTEGLTLLMFQVAVSVLRQHWIHGDRLRDWHNKRFAPTGTNPGSFGDNLVDCATVSTIMGRAALVASYREVMQDKKAYKGAVQKAAAAVALQAITEYYREQGVAA